jgi:hypothetical protein
MATSHQQQNKTSHVDALQVSYTADSEHNTTCCYGFATVLASRHTSCYELAHACPLCLTIAAVPRLDQSSWQ